MQRLDARRHGAFAREHRIVTVVFARDRRCERTQPLVGRDLPCADAADFEGAALVALGQSPHRTPDETAGEAEVSFAKRAVTLDHLRAEVAEAHAESQLVLRAGLAQAIVHDARRRGIGEAHGIDAHSNAHAREHRIVQRRGPAEVRVIDAIGTAVIEVETADLGLACRDPTARCPRARRMRRRRT